MVTLNQQLMADDPAAKHPEVEQSVLEHRSQQDSMSSSLDLLQNSLQHSLQYLPERSRHHLSDRQAHFQTSDFQTSVSQAGFSRSQWHDLRAIGIPELLAPVQLFVLLGVLSLILGEGWKHWGDSIILRFKILQQVPCPQCRFFCKSIHLHCTVRPLDALTTRAIRCPDYHPH